MRISAFFALFEDSVFMKLKYSVPHLEMLENRLALAGAIIATGVGAGGSPNVRVFDAETNQETASFFAYNQAFTGGVRVAVADITADGIPDIITAAGPGGGPQVNVYDGESLNLITSFLAYDSAFSGGVFIAAGNFDEDRFLEIVTGAGAGGGPNVRIFNIENGRSSLASSFFAYDLAFTGGVTVAAENYNGVAGDEIITGAGPGAGPHVNIFQSNGFQVGGFFAYSQQFTGGVNVAVGDLDLNGKSEIITGPGAGGSPNVRVFNGGNATLLSSFFAFDEAFSGGVEVSLTDRDFDGFADIVTAAGLGGGPEVRIWNSVTSTAIDSYFAYSTDFRGGVLPAGTVRVPAQLNGTFIDPTALIVRASEIELGARILIAPFVVLDATNGPISIGDDTNLQDNVVVISGANGVAIGDKVILAHGASVLGSSQIGKIGGLPVFVGFNAVIDGAVIEEDTFISYQSRVAPGVVIRTGTYVKTGKFIQTQAEADNPDLGKVGTISNGQRDFMNAVLDVNVDLARGYNDLYFENGILSVLGINLNPATFYNSVEALPTLGGSPGEAITSFRNRIIGNATLANSLAQLNLVMGNRDSIRTDEGTPFVFGTFRGVGDQFTAHALEHTGISAGDNNQFGFHSLVHGGPDTSTIGSITQGTTLGSNITVGDYAVVFRSTIQDGVTLGFRSFIDNSLIMANTVIEDRAIYINNDFVGYVEW